MSVRQAAVEELLELAIRHVNAGQRERARVLCELAEARHPPHAAILQLLALLDLQQGDAAQALRRAHRSLALRRDHLPTLRVAGDAARAAGEPRAALQTLERSVVLAPDDAGAWFQLSLVRQDLRDLDGTILALREVLRLSPEQAEAYVNLGIVLQDLGRVDEAMREFARAFLLQENTFGRIAHALAASNVGRLWLKIEDLRATLRASV